LLTLFQLFLDYHLKQQQRPFGHVLLLTDIRQVFRKPLVRCCVQLDTDCLWRSTVVLRYGQWHCKCLSTLLWLNSRIGSKPSEYFIFEFPCITNLKYITNQQNPALTVLCLLKATSMLYMFRMPFAPIFRSTTNCNSSHWFFHAVIYKVTYKQVLNVIQVVVQ
jgi:hypothetical protein